ncbi:hypothetical protein TNCV_2451721 [Trichonephila clavipes]|nr:hypothetical protein TNCV_2451721 [Trichonephila clavipes]
MEVPLRTAYGQNGRCSMQPKPSSLRAQAQLKHELKLELVEEKQNLLDIREKRENARDKHVLDPLLSPILITTPAISTSSSSTQAELLPSISAKAATVLEPEPHIPMSNDVLSNMFTPTESSSIVSTSLSNDIQPPSTSNTVRDTKLNSKNTYKKTKKRITKKIK